jgi:hypothetical protein
LTSTASLVSFATTLPAHEQWIEQILRRHRARVSQDDFFDVYSWFAAYEKNNQKSLTASGTTQKRSVAASSMTKMTHVTGNCCSALRKITDTSCFSPEISAARHKAGAPLCISALKRSYHILSQ